MGADHAQPDRPHLHVLVLRHGLHRRSMLVEEVPHHHADHPVRLGHYLLLLLPRSPPHVAQWRLGLRLPRWRLRCRLRLPPPHLLPLAVH